MAEPRPSDAADTRNVRRLWSGNLSDIVVVLIGAGWPEASY
jgi:hypothetical protein